MSKDLEPGRFVILTIRYSTKKLIILKREPSFQGSEMDDEFCRKRARTVRDLAERADPFIKKRLLELAKHYERRISFGSNEKAAVEGEPEQI